MSSNRRKFKVPPNSPSESITQIPLYILNEIFEESFKTGYKLEARREDVRLTNWHFWQNTFRKQVERIKRRTHKEDRQVLINQIEQYRYVRQRKQILEYARQLIKPYKSDEIRGVGDVRFWRIPEKLRDLPNCSDCFVTDPYSFRFNKPIGDINRLPKLIEEEMNLSVEELINSNAYLTSKYLRKVEKKMKESIDFVHPVSPELSQVCITGVIKPLLDEETERVKEALRQQQLDEEQQRLADAKEIIIRINDHVLDTVYPMKRNIEIDIAFQDLVSRKRTEHLTIDNLSDEQIVIEWTNDALALRTIPFIKHYPVFRFKADPIVLDAHQILKVPVQFSSDRVGVFHEKWILHLNKPFFDGNFPGQMIVRFWGHCYDEMWSDLYGKPDEMCVSLNQFNDFVRLFQLNGSDNELDSNIGSME